MKNKCELCKGKGYVRNIDVGITGPHQYWQRNCPECKPDKDMRTEVPFFEGLMNWLFK